MQILFDVDPDFLGLPDEEPIGSPRDIPEYEDTDTLLTTACLSHREYERIQIVTMYQIDDHERVIPIRCARPWNWIG